MLVRLTFGLIVLSAPIALAQAEADPPVTECQSCTARHQSLQALQNARTQPEPDECGAARTTEHKLDPNTPITQDCAGNDPERLLPDPAPDS